MDLVKEILDLEPKEGTVNIYWLGGTSYIIRSRKLTIGLDIYLSNVCMGKDGSYKRLVPSPVKAEDLKLDYIVATHDHGDHFDEGSLSTLIESKDSTKLIGPASVKDAAKKLKINEKYIIE
ncbi:MAG: MBL fold metallo-hydrolase, partial [Actinomycetia bacterium]|nr:MBL fold metallo-hydrolase [Actinomycetes bacterium]